MAHLLSIAIAFERESGKQVVLAGPILTRQADPKRARKIIDAGEKVKADAELRQKYSTLYVMVNGSVHGEHEFRDAQAQASDDQLVVSVRGAKQSAAAADERIAQAEKELAAAKEERKGAQAILDRDAPKLPGAKKAPAKKAAEKKEKN